MTMEPTRPFPSVGEALRGVLLDDGPDSQTDGRTARRRLQDGMEALLSLQAEIIDYLDRLEPDPDLEPDDDLEHGGDIEPSLGSVHNRSQLAWAEGDSRDCEWDHDGREPDEDHEPTLGAPEPVGRFRPSRRDLDQTDWARGPDVEEREEDPEYEPQGVMIPCGKTMIDLEDYEKSDYEPSMGAAEGETGSVAWAQGGSVFEEEPSLGSVGHIDQRHWANHTDPNLWLCLDVEEACEDEGAQCDDEGDVSSVLPAPDGVTWFPDHTPPWPPQVVANDAAGTRRP